jgi:hypothetical protein
MKATIETKVSGSGQEWLIGRWVEENVFAFCPNVIQGVSKRNL